MVVRDGEIVEAGMRRNDLSEHDLEEDMRLKAGLTRLNFKAIFLRYF